MPVIALLIILALPAMAACSNPSFDSPKNTGQETESSSTRVPPALPSSTLDEPLKHFRDKFGALEGVEGTGLGLDAQGEEAITVWVSTTGIADKIPSRFEGHPVLIREVPGGFHATTAPG